MTKYSWILVAAALSPLVPLACGDNNTTGGTSTTGAGGGGTTTSSSVTATSTATGTSTGSTTSGASTGTGGSADCTGILTAVAPDCETCAETNCCQEINDCNAADGCIDSITDSSLVTPDNQAAHDALLTCAQGSCMTECFNAPPMPVDATCSVPTPSPTNGSCVTLDATITCNPVTNSPCKTDQGEACDLNQGGGYQCFAAPNNEPLCGMCPNGNSFCKGGSTCVGTGICGKFCCDDTDCGAGKCDKTGMLPGGVGICTGGNMGTSSSSGTGSSSSATGSSSSGSSGSGAGGGASASASSAVASASSAVSSGVTGAGGASSSASTGP